jgi:hypothetical protein
MSQTRLLARTFFTRLFESELMPEGPAQVQLMLWGALLAACPATIKSLTVTEQYQRLLYSKGALDLAFDVDRMALIVLSMMAFGVVGLAIWDGVFPDRRDVRILGPLPVPTHRFVAARLIAVWRVFALFGIPVCVIQSVAFGLSVAGFGDPVPRLHGITAHFATIVSAGAFVFSALIGIQCVLLIGFGRNAAQHVSVAFQLLFAVGIIQLLVFMPDLTRVLRDGGSSHDGLTTLAALPPTWFFGLYEGLAGTADAQTGQLARIAAVATSASIVLSLVLYGLAYAPLSKRALEGPIPRARRPRREWITGLVRYLPIPGLRNPVRTAVRQFALRTIGRSRYHRMMLAIYAGIALAIIFSSVVSIVVRGGVAGLSRPSVPMLTLPLIYQFLMLIGVRVMIAVPIEPKARWVFRVCESAQRNGAVLGARDTMMTLVVIPSALFALAQGLIFWNWAQAVSHAVFCLLLGRLFAELLVMRLDKLPFACTYYPGRSRVFTLWPLYVMAFFIYTLAFAEIDRAFINRPGGLLRFCGVVIVATELLAWRRRRFLVGQPALRYEEEDPDLMFQGFNLSEGMAAAPKDGRELDIVAPTRT